MSGLKFMGGLFLAINIPLHDPVEMAKMISNIAQTVAAHGDAHAVLASADTAGEPHIEAKLPGEPVRGLGFGGYSVR